MYPRLQVGVGERAPAERGARGARGPLAARRAPLHAALREETRRRRFVASSLTHTLRPFLTLPVYYYTTSRSFRRYYLINQRNPQYSCLSDRADRGFLAKYAGYDEQSSVLNPDLDKCVKIALKTMNSVSGNPNNI